MDRSKIVIIGAGHVGSHCALALALQELCGELVLVDTQADKAAAQAMDVADALSFPPRPVLVRAGSYADCADADIVVVAIGKARLPGQTRLDMLGDSAVMLHGLIGELKPLNLPGIVISITNPADIVADYLRKGLNLPRERVFGTGTMLDTARLIRILSEESGVARASVEAFSLGEHGNSSMIPFSQVRLGGIACDAFPGLDKNRILERTREAGNEIIEGKKSTEFGIGQCLSVLCKAVLCDEQRVLPLSVLLEGEYGQTGLHCGVPCRVGRAGISRVVELPLTKAELAQLDGSCQIIKEYIAKAQIAAPLL